MKIDPLKFLFLRSMKPVIILLFLLVGHKAFADLPARTYPYTLHSQNSRFYLKSIPFSMFGEAGKTYVFNKGGEKLYTLDSYLGEWTFLSDNGRYVATASYWGWMDSSVVGHAIRFYDNGKLVKNYDIKDVIENQDNLLHTTSHVIWKYDRFAHEFGHHMAPPDDSLNIFMDKNQVFATQDSLYITTIERKLLIFYLPTGKLVRSEEAIPYFENRRYPVIPQPPDKIKFPDYQLPPTNIPLFRNSKSQVEDLLTDLLELKPTDDSYNSNLIVTIQILIDRRSNSFKIAGIEIHEKDKPDDDFVEKKNSERLKQQIAGLFEKKKFNLDDFPAWVEKWYVDGYFYYSYQ